MTGDAILLQTLIEAVQTSRWSRFWVLASAIALYLPVQAIVYFARQARAEEYANLLTRQVREDLFDRLGAIRLSHFTREGADKYLSNLTVQVDSIKLNVIDVALWGSYLLCQLVCATATILFINPVLGLIAIILCLPLSVSPILSKKAVERARNLLVHSTNNLNESSSDLLHGLVDWRIHGAERSVDRRYSQAGHIFHASIRDNVTLFDDSLPDSMVLEACAKAQIGDWARERGLDYEIDNALSSLSGGEKQRILLARFFACQARFGVLDEITSRLDMKTVARVEKRLADELDGFVYVSHRLDSGIMQLVDQVIVVDGMRIVAMGSPEEVESYARGLTE